MRLKSISLSKLRQAELISFVEDVKSFIEKHDLNALHINDSSQILIRYYPEVLKLAKEYGPCPIAKELKTIHMKRVEYAGTIFTQVLILEKLKGECMQEETNIASLLVKLHLRGIRKHNRSGVNGKLWSFFSTLENNDKTRAAFEALDLMQYVEELRQLDNRFHELFILRRKAKTKAAKRSENKGIQNKTEEILRVFFAQLKQAQQIYPELQDDYAPLFAELNRVIPKYTKLIKTRATLNKKRAATKAKAKAEAEAKLKTMVVNAAENQSMSISKNGNNVKKAGVRKPKATKKRKRKNKNVVVAAQRDDSINENKNNISHNNLDEQQLSTSISSTGIINPNDVFPLNSQETKKNGISVDGT